MVRRRRDDRNDKKPKEFEERLLEIRRVTRVTTGGRRMSFRATMLIGNKKGKIGIGIAKGPDVSVAVRKAAHEAYKSIIKVPVTEGRTVPYALDFKHKASRIKLIPAASGTGLKAGSSLRSVLELAGYENILSKIVGSNNKLNVALTTFKALTSYKHAEEFSTLNVDKKETSDEAKNEKAKDKKTTNKEKTKKPAKKVDEKKPTAKKDTKKKVEKKEDKKESTDKKAESK